MSRGNRPLYVRAPADQRDRWKAAAERAGATDFSTWVRTTLDRAAKAGETALELTSELEPPALAIDCPHPRDQRQRRSYGTICGACGRVVGLAG